MSAIKAESFESVFRRKQLALEAKHGVFGLLRMMRYLDGCYAFFKDNPEVGIWEHFWLLVHHHFKISGPDAYEVFLWWANNGSY